MLLSYPYPIRMGKKLLLGSSENAPTVTKAGAPQTSALPQCEPNRLWNSPSHLGEGGERPSSSMELQIWILSLQLAGQVGTALPSLLQAILSFSQWQSTLRAIHSFVHSLKLSPSWSFAIESLHLKSAVHVLLLPFCYYFFFIRSSSLKASPLKRFVNFRWSRSASEWFSVWNQWSGRSVDFFI